MISVCFQGKPFNITVIQVYALTTNAEETEIEWFYEELPEKAMAPHSSTLAWKIPWVEEPGGLQSMGSRRVRYDWLHFHFSLSFTRQGNGNLLQCSSLENPRDREPGGLPSMGSHRVGHDWSDLAAVAAAWRATRPSRTNIKKDILFLKKYYFFLGGHVLQYVGF